MFEPCRTFAGVCVKLISGDMKRSGNRGKGRSGQRGNTIWRSRRGERQGANENPLCQFDLEKIVSGRFGVGERRLCRATEGIGSWAAARSALFCRTTPP